MDYRVALICSQQPERKAIIDALTAAGASGLPAPGVRYRLPVAEDGFDAFELVIGLTGDGAENSRVVTDEILAEGSRPAFALSVGAAPGLGQVFVPSKITSADTHLEPDPALFEVAQSISGGVLIGETGDASMTGFLEAASAKNVPALAVRAASEEGAAGAALAICEQWRLRRAFDGAWAARVIAIRADAKPEANAETLVRQLIEHVRREATQQHTFNDGTRVDIVFPGGVVEVEKDLRVAAKRAEGIEQIERYLRELSRTESGSLIGYVTDGVEWLSYVRSGDELREVSKFTVEATEESVSALIDWLAGDIGTGVSKELPTPERINARLGAGSTAHQADRAFLADMWRDLQGNPETQLKRELWARSLRTALGTQFTDSDDLFIDHTYLVVLAELIANALLDEDIEQADATALLRGTLLTDARRISGVVEADFFDWVLDHQHGAAFVKRLSSRVVRFDWASVEHDVLKALYESVIGPETRKALGEYYTPDWLAKQVVEAVVTDPRTQSVLDPACGSGTFLFHAVRQYLGAAEAAGISTPDALRSVTGKVFGFDLHPVAVSLARVTYLLAIGVDRLSDPARGTVHIPVFLADSLRWDVRDDDLFTATDLHIAVEDDDVGHSGQGSLLAEDFVFPGSVVADPARFEALIDELARLANGAKKPTEAQAAKVMDRLAITQPGDRELVTKTLTRMRSLVEHGRDGIWGYYIRNQARPAWLSCEGQGVDCLVGNPPWLAYFVMTGGMQERFKEMSQARGLWTGGKLARSQDLSSLFVTRTTELYLKSGGRFGFVMPEGIVRAQQFEGLRSGDWSVRVGKGKSRHVTDVVSVAVHEPWNVGTLAESFPVPSSVMFGERLDADPHPMPVTMRRLTDRDGGGEQTDRVEVAEEVRQSPYEAIFRQGATLVPRALTFVEVGEPVKGAPANLRPVRSLRSNQEKAPWKTLPDVTGTVDQASLFATHLGRTILPFRPLAPATTVLPIQHGAVVGDDPPAGMRDWWDRVTGLWDEYKPAKERKTLAEQYDFFGKLTSQLPFGGRRVVYAMSGSKLASAVVEGEIAIDAKLYWAPAGSIEEANYLCAILNSETLRARTEAYQTHGLFGARDFHKHVFVNPIPTFDGDIAEHAALAGLGARATEIAATVAIPDGIAFTKARGLIRDALDADGIAAEIDAAVAALLDSEGVG